MTNTDISLVIIEDITTKIKSGVLLPKDKLPSKNEMMRQYNTDLKSVQKALRILKNDGVIESKAKSGFYIKEHSYNNYCLNYITHIELQMQMPVVNHFLCSLEDDEVFPGMETLPKDLETSILSRLYKKEDEGRFMFRDCYLFIKKGLDVISTIEGCLLNMKIIINDVTRRNNICDVKIYYRMTTDNEIKRYGYKEKFFAMVEDRKYLNKYGKLIAAERRITPYDFEIIEGNMIKG